MLNDTEKDILKLIANNQMLFDVVQKIILSHFSLDKVSTSMTNENMGAVVRAKIEGVKKVEEAFVEIAKYKLVTPKVGMKNPAR